jgi:hypothetical protein
VQSLGGAPKREFLGDSDERAQKSEFHGSF